MTKVPSLRVKAMYIMFAVALVFGLAATVLTAVPEPAQAEIPGPASFTITGGSYNLNGDGTLAGFFTGTNSGIASGGYFVDMTYAVTVSGGPNGGLSTSGGFFAQAYIQGDRIDFWGQYDTSMVVAMTSPSGSLVIGADGKCDLDYTASDGQGGTWSWTKDGVIGIPDLLPEIALDVKGSIQKFVLVNVPLYSTNVTTYANFVGLSEQEFESRVENNGLYSTLTWVQSGIMSPDIATWVITPGVNLATADIEIYDGGDPVAGDPWIEIRSTVPGDCHIGVKLNWPAPGGAGTVWSYLDVALVEKKWGVIHHTILDMDPEIPERVADPQSSIQAEAGTPLNPHYQEFSDYVYAWFYWGELEIRCLTAGHAIVHWWLIEDDAAGVNEQAILDIMDYLGEAPDTTTCDNPNVPAATQPSGCGSYDPLPALPPVDQLNAVWSGNEANYTSFTNAIDGFRYLQKSADGTYIEAVSEGDFPGEDRGRTMVEVENIGGEDILVVTLTEYPIKYHGENPVCIEMGYKQYGEAPPVCQAKTPQLRWAGEKIVLEKEWPVEPGIDFVYDELSRTTAVYLDLYAAIYSREGEAIGNLEPIVDVMGIDINLGDQDVVVVAASELGLPTGADQVVQMLGDTLFVDIGIPFVNQYSSVSRCILVSEQSGEADVNAALYGVYIMILFRGSPTDLGSVIGYEAGSYGPEMNHGFVVYFLAFEDVVLTDVDEGALVDITPTNTLMNLPVEKDVDVAVQVSGYFQYEHSHLPPALDLNTGDIRAQKIVDSNNDGIVDRVLPAGRWVMPDDWWAMANHNYALRSNWDLMDSAAEDDISSDYVAAMWWWGEEGPYNTDVFTVTPPGLAEEPTIGPFSTLQRWSCDLMWEASATVPTSDFNYAARNTVVPDGVMNWYDAPMPQALVIFDVTGSTLPMGEIPGITELWKGDLEGYGYNSVSGEFPSPYYLVEVPSSPYIPPYGYEWNSWWDFNQGPYEFWEDLSVKSLDDTEPRDTNIMDVEVYSDNHGIAGFTAPALNKAGGITVTATADFPDRFLKGKYGPMTSDDIDIVWGVVEFDPDFQGVPRNCEEVEGCCVEFTNMTTGATTPYESATWDFGDQTIPVVQTGPQAQEGQTVTHCYEKAGVFDVTLTMEDADHVIAYQIEFDYITVGEGGAGNTATWSFNGPGCFPKHLPDNFFDSVQLGSLTGVPSAVQGVYYNNAGIWTFWAPGAPGTTLATLVGGLSADYLVCVTGAATWDIPLP